MRRPVLEGAALDAGRESRVRRHLHVVVGVRRQRREVEGHVPRFRGGGGPQQRSPVVLVMEREPQIERSHPTDRRGGGRGGPGAARHCDGTHGGGLGGDRCDTTTQGCERDNKQHHAYQGCGTRQGGAHTRASCREQPTVLPEHMARLRAARAQARSGGWLANSEPARLAAPGTGSRPASTPRSSTPRKVEPVICAEVTTVPPARSAPVGA